MNFGWVACTNLSMILGLMSGFLQWNDSIDESPEGSANPTNRPWLPTPKRKAVSPLKKHETPKFARRRKMKRWTPLEEDTLRTGVGKYVCYFCILP